MESKSSSLIETLIQRGWCFNNIEELKGLIQIHIATVGDSGNTVNSIESGFLVNMDLRTIGGKSLPQDPTLLKKSSFLQGPKVLQVVSVRNICQSSIEESSVSSSKRRLLRFGLTDGHLEIVAIEYSPMAGITDEIIPGTKVRLDNKVPMNSGILCLNPKVATVMGGVVQSLYEEWQMTKKYSGFSRSSLRLTQKNDGDGPPPFEKLQIEARSHLYAPCHSASRPAESNFEATMPTAKSGTASSSREVGGNQGPISGPDKSNANVRPASLADKTEEKPSSSEPRPKEVSEAVPVQNQAAARKLLEKMSQPIQSNRRPRGGRHRGKEREEESAVLTLDEWKRSKAGGKPSTIGNYQNVSNDEQLAWQLQNQLDMEDSHVRTDHMSEAEKIRMSMFSFEGAEEERGRGGGFRGRGRGRGRGGGRGRGRGRGRGSGFS
ncbi:hypothetical protein GIB67_030673 [Kingdonia uniflora]|uniref:RecQ mediated genome instability protein 1 OB-fold domain-containing protein n=1 Tax=Kingdonia uniflora TaxID=39325 RepID=A0A7J7NIZ1_9MAGN|nr:hypothetical protein GIB67_030673 [Kingdonia uniflora]